ncbi:MAG: acyltransferase [Lachnospiraceae bacterium]|nr:acyltransferase [Lachnospiraceae bacterium]
MMKDNSKTQKRKGLDALRGIGITGIVLYHMFPSVIRGGFLGVPLFFVLSGYLMFTTSEQAWESGDFHIRDYYKKRIKKIVPPLFIMVMAVCCYLTIIKSSMLIGIRHEICSIFLGYENWWQISRNASYFSKLASSSPFTHLWFLAVEIQFYLLWPLLFLLYKKCCQVTSGKKMCFVFLLLALLSAGKMLFLYTPGGDPSRVYYGTDTMAFPLLIGIFLGALRQQYHTLCFTKKKNTLVLSGIFLLIICVLFLTVDGQFSFLYQGGMFFVSLFFAFMIHILENQEASPENLSKSSFLSLLGKKSYGIYLWHYPIIILALV